MKRSAMSEKTVALIHMPAYGIAVHMPIDFESEYSSGKTSVRYYGKNRGFKDVFKKYINKYIIKYTSLYARGEFLNIFNFKFSF